MPRLPRIELPNAVYFVTSKAAGNQQPWAETSHCELFLQLLEEACQRVDWEVHAFALLPARYHLLVRTHQPNLSLGMKWLQGSFSQAVRGGGGSARNGPLLEGRYKAAPVQQEPEARGYLLECADYLHLLPEKEDLLEPWEPLDSSRWNSIAFYTARRMDCPRWLSPEPILAQADLPYSYLGRMRYLRRLESRVGSWNSPAGKRAEKVRCTKFQRGWFIGDPEYGRALKEEVVKRNGAATGTNEHGSQAGEIARAEEILREQITHLGLDLASLRQRPKTDPLKIALATVIRENTMVSNNWLSERLEMGHPSRVSRYTRGELSERLAQRVADSRAQLRELENA